MGRASLGSLSNFFFSIFFGVAFYSASLGSSLLGAPVCVCVCVCVVLRLWVLGGKAAGGAEKASLAC